MNTHKLGKLSSSSSRKSHRFVEIPETFPMTHHYDPFWLDHAPQAFTAEQAEAVLFHILSDHAQHSKQSRATTPRKVAKAVKRDAGEKAGGVSEDCQVVTSNTQRISRRHTRWRHRGFKAEHMSRCRKNDRWPHSPCLRPPKSSGRDGCLRIYVHTKKRNRAHRPTLALDSFPITAPSCAACMGYVI